MVMMLSLRGYSIVKKKGWEENLYTRFKDNVSMDEVWSGLIDMIGLLKDLNSCVILDV